MLNWDDYNESEKTQKPQLQKEQTTSMESEQTLSVQEEGSENHKPKDVADNQAAEQARANGVEPEPASGG